MLCIDGIIYSLQRYGGISVYFNELLRHIAGRNIQISKITYKNAFNHLKDHNGKAEELRRPRLLERYRRCEISTKINLFHSSYYRLPSRKVPVITTVHDFTYEYFLKEKFRSKIHKWQKFLAIRNSQAIICVSENTRRDLLNFIPNIDPAIVNVIYHGVSEQFFLLPGRTVVTSEKPYVLFVGERNGYKNFELTVKAVSTLSDLRLICVGGPPLSSDEKLLVRNFLSSRFEYLKNVTNQELNALYNQAYCLAYPSAYEGFGMPILEAMKSGCPVIARNCSSIPEVAGEAAFLLQTNDLDELANAFIELKNNYKRENFRQKGFEQAKKFSWQKCCQETIKVYERIKRRSF
jgi:mannosyltransferase